MLRGTMFTLALPLLLTSAFAAAESERMVDGRAAYEALCAQCHETGKDDAPVTSDIEQWSDRSALWEGVLFEHARKGYINMPARGGHPRASDYEVNAAAEYMLTIAHPEMPAD